MPAFMSGMGMRTQQPRRQFNQQPPGANQFTQALQNQAGQTTPNTQGQAPQATGGVDQKAPAATAANPYMQANPWTYNQGGYQPNATAYTPEWMKKPEPAPVAPTAPKIKKRQVANYTAEAEDRMGSVDLAKSGINTEAAKRGKTVSQDQWNDLAARYMPQVQNGMVSGKMYNQIINDLFGEDVEIDDPNWKPPTQPAPTPAPTPEQPIRMGPGFPGGGPIGGGNRGPWNRRPYDNWGGGDRGPIPMPKMGPEPGESMTPEKMEAQKAKYQQLQDLMKELGPMRGIGGGGGMYGGTGYGGGMDYMFDGMRQAL